jgi:hypothetical protein
MYRGIAIKEQGGRPSPIRAICVSKNNYAEFDPPALLFELRDGFRWAVVDTEITAEDLYNKKKNKGRPAEKKDSVKTKILRLLGSGEPMLSAELEQKVIEAAACSTRTLKSAKEDLGVGSFQSGRQWFSVLPGQSAINVQGAINSGSGGSL